MSIEKITAQEELTYLQSEANKINGLSYFKAVLNALEPDKGTFFGINGKPLTEKQTNLFATQLKKKALKTVIAIELGAVQEVEYEPKKGIATKEYGIVFKYTYREGAVIDDTLSKYLAEARKFILFYINSRLIDKLEDFRKSRKKNKHFKMSIHGVTQFYGGNKQLKAFSDENINEFQETTGLVLTNRPESYGVVLNQAQKRVFEGILKAFTNSNYKGEEQIDKATYSSNIYPVVGKAKAYKNVDKIPVVRLTQAQVIELAGYDLKRQGDKQDVIDALEHLATKQFCFYWLRLQKTNKMPVKDKNGDYSKEEVMEVGTLLRIKTIRDEAKILQYYEIHPSAPLLDQISSYFLMVPNNWREDVEQIIGKRASSYTYEFLLWLRLQYEQIRRYNKNGGKDRKPKPFTLSKSWEEVAIALKMPETMYKRNRKKASAIIQDAYSVAIKLGYLIKVDNNGATDILYLNESYYPKSGELV
jgi:hypothetical protein